jgi:hypothetical protein
MWKKYAQLLALAGHRLILEDGPELLHALDDGEDIDDDLDAGLE